MEPNGGALDYVYDFHLFATFVSGALNWLITLQGERVDRDQIIFLILMSIASESFWEVNCLLHNHINLEIFWRSRGIWPTTTSVDTFYIWVMRMYDKTESWTKLFKFGLNNFVHFFGCTRHGEILVKKHQARSQFKDKWITKVAEVEVRVCFTWRWIFRWEGSWYSTLYPPTIVPAFIESLVEQTCKLDKKSKALFLCKLSYIVCSPTCLY